MRLQRFTDLSEASDAASFEAQLIAIANEMEFGLALALVVTELPGTAPRVVRFGNTPAAFMSSSTNPEEIARDPVTRKLKASSVPVTYDQLTYVRENAGDLWENQAQHGYRTGISVALHLPGQRHFALGLDREKPLPKSEEKLARMLGDLQLLAVHAQESAMKLGEPAHKIVLTPKEQLVLRMTKEGKSAKVIGARLFCAESTVNFHLANVRAKLGVSSKHQAVLMASALGLLE